MPPKGPGGSARKKEEEELDHFNGGPRSEAPSMVLFQEECGYIFAIKIVAYLSCSAGCMHFAQTKLPISALAIAGPRSQVSAG